MNKPLSFIHKKSKQGAGGVMLYIHNRISENISIVEELKDEDKVYCMD